MLQKMDTFSQAVRRLDVFILLLLLLLLLSLLRAAVGSHDGVIEGRVVATAD